MSNSPTERPQFPTDFIGFGRGNHPSGLQSSTHLSSMFNHPLGMAAFVASGRAPSTGGIIPNPYISTPSSIPSPMYNGVMNQLDGMKTSSSPMNYPPNPYMSRFDQLMQCWPHNFRSLDLPGTVRSTKASRESTSYLKAWLQKHRKNPYPTKNQKIWLAYITNMTLTQVSTWFANARRRIKKEMAAGKSQFEIEDGPDDVINDDEDLPVDRNMLSPPFHNDRSFRENSPHSLKNYDIKSRDSPPDTSHRSIVAEQSKWTKQSAFLPSSSSIFDKSDHYKRDPEDEKSISDRQYSRRNADYRFPLPHFPRKFNENYTDDHFSDILRPNLSPPSRTTPPTGTKPTDGEINNNRKPSDIDGVSPFVKITQKNTLPSTPLKPPRSNPASTTRGIWSLAKIADSKDDKDNANHKRKLNIRNDDYPIPPKLPSYDYKHSPSPNHDLNDRVDDNFIRKRNETFERKSSSSDSISQDKSIDYSSSSHVIQYMASKFAEQNALAWMQNYIPPEHLEKTKEAFAAALTSSFLSSLHPHGLARNFTPELPRYKGSVFTSMAPIISQSDKNGFMTSQYNDRRRRESDDSIPKETNKNDREMSDQKANRETKENCSPCERSSSTSPISSRTSPRRLSPELPK